MNQISSIVVASVSFAVGVAVGVEYANRSDKSADELPAKIIAQATTEVVTAPAADERKPEARAAHSAGQGSRPSKAQTEAPGYPRVMSTIAAAPQTEEELMALVATDAERAVLSEMKHFDFEATRIIAERAFGELLYSLSGSPEKSQRFDEITTSLSTHPAVLDGRATLKDVACSPRICALAVQADSTATLDSITRQYRDPENGAGMFSQHVDVEAAGGVERRLVFSATDELRSGFHAKFPRRPPGG